VVATSVRNTILFLIASILPALKGDSKEKVRRGKIVYRGHDARGLGQRHHVHNAVVCSTSSPNSIERRKSNQHKLAALHSRLQRNATIHPAKSVAAEAVERN
jgi:hypothetical protein